MRQIDGETKVLGLIGQNTNYTLSPYIHNASIKELGLNYVYLNFQLKESDVENFLKSFHAIGGVGLNVTKPHKLLVKKFCHHQNLNSINTLSQNNTHSNTNWVGHSTDGLGFEHGLQKIGENIAEFENIIFIGGGGAAVALATHFFANKNIIKNIFVMQRNPARFEDFCSQINNTSKRIQYVSWNPKSFSETIAKTQESKTLMIQASSAPASGDMLNDFVSSFVNYTGTFVDLVYDKPSKLYFEALNKGLKTQDGLPMLIEQARLSQEIWWGKSASYETIAKALKHHLG